MIGQRSGAKTRAARGLLVLLGQHSIEQIGDIGCDRRSSGKAGRRTGRGRGVVRPKRIRRAAQLFQQQRSQQLAQRDGVARPFVLTGAQGADLFLRQGIGSVEFAK